MTDLLTIGEPMVVFASQNAEKSLANSTDFKKYLAGAEVNVAVGISRLGHSVQYITQLGRDPWGEYILAKLSRCKINTDYVSLSSTFPTGIMFKSLTHKGDPKTYYMRKNSAASKIIPENLKDISFTTIKRAHITGIFLATSSQALDSIKYLIQKLNNLHIPITFDPNLRPDLWLNKENMISTLNEIAKYTNTILPGLVEGKILTRKNTPDEIAQFYFNQSTLTQTVIIKLGAKGAKIFTRDGFKKFIPGFPAKKVIDTVGAGDGFATGVISGLLENLSLEDAVLRGNAIGSLAVQSPGDNTGYPSQKELQEFMKGYNNVTRNSKDELFESTN